MKKRVHKTAQEKAEILSYAKEHGVKNAVKKYKVGEASIYKWRSDLKKAAVDSKPVEKAQEPKKQTLNSEKLIGGLSVDKVTYVACLAKNLSLLVSGNVQNGLAILDGGELTHSSLKMSYDNLVACHENLQKLIECIAILGQLVNKGE